MIAAAFSLIAAAVAAYVALLSARFARAPSFPDQGWFARVALTAAAFTACNVVTTAPGAPDDLVVLFARFQIFIGTLHAASWLHYSSVHLRTPSRLDRPLSIALVALGALVLVPYAGFTGTVTRTTFAALGIHYNNAEPTAVADGVLAVAYAALLLVTARFWRAARRGVPHAALHAASLVVLLAMAVNDGLVLAGVLSTPYLLDLGFVFPVAAVAYALGARVVDDARALAQLRHALEQQVEERTGELALSESARVRAEKLAALGQLSAGVAHEVNNPAAILSANLRYLSDAADRGRALPAEAAEVLRESRQAVDRIARIVRQLLDTSRLAAEAGRPGAPVDLAVAAADAVRLARPRTGAVRIDVDVPAELWATAQDELVVQVIANLVVNGAQAIPPGRQGHVTVRGARAGDRVRLLVEDDGAGMDVETLRRVFEPFFSTKPFGAGTGLGLAVSRGLVSSMGGDLRLESALGVGTRAVVELPAGSAPATAGAPQPAPHAEAPERRRSVLLVDDDPAVRASLARLLSVDYAVTVAGGPGDAIPLARSGRFDVILCDVMMPDGGAERLAAALDREAPAVAARLVFLTGGASTLAARAFLADDPRPVLEKPLDLDAFARTVRPLEEARRTPAA
ncbi:ATP-binding protein [Anaeromyxobacter oryzae]|uniref:histidine kinase n=1 Tax=Anaeromyxobacter oryzae TaxID=2918170 RepID=A0ABM7X392_9BACT|nr:ATP-binding protein [Anaeromyxobacter oryzae]BDG06268.1 hypothetical protein AMOR_52640 [Anaeromyxobacter oryzae]